MSHGSQWLWVAHLWPLSEAEEYASDDREYYAKMLILPYVEQKVLHREHIKDITAERLQEGLRMVLENIGDGIEYKCNNDMEMA